MKLFFAVILFIPAFVLVIIVKVIFSLQLWLLLLLFCVVLLRRTTNSFQKYLC